MRPESICALKWSIEKASAGQAVLLTLTRPDASRKAILAGWNALRTDINKKRTFSGVRVLEQHPGGHGWHIHAVVTEKLDASGMWKICRAHGFHWISLKKIYDAHGVGRYLSKYLSKGDNTGRSWSTFGGFEGYKVKNILHKTTLKAQMETVTLTDMLWAFKAHDKSWALSSCGAWFQMRLRRRIAEVQLMLGKRQWRRYWKEVVYWETKFFVPSVADY